MDALGRLNDGAVLGRPHRPLRLGRPVPGDDSPPKSPAPNDGASTTRSASAAGIDVQASWLSGDQLTEYDLAAYPPQQYLLLELKLDTHSGDLGSIDLVSSAQVDTPSGLLRPQAWVPREDGSHHRDGVLVFPRPDASAPRTFSLKLGSDAIELTWDNVPEG